jgi:flagellar hook assembly protein FlgD
MTVVDASAVAEGPLAAGALFLSPGAPNPFGERTAFSFHLGQAGPAELLILDAAGRLVRRLAQRSFPAGATHITWNGEDDHGRRVPAGVYFARLESAAGSRTRRVICTR